MPHDLSCDPSDVSDRAFRTGQDLLQHIVLLSVLPALGSAQLFSVGGPLQDCSIVSGDQFASLYCECAKIDRDIARLECFDEGGDQFAL